MYFQISGSLDAKLSQQSRVAAVIYHLFLAEDNSPELFAQAKRIHSLIPYTALKQVIRFANPAAVMAGVLDLFLAQPFGAKSLLQRIFSLALGDSIRTVQKSIDGLALKINEPVFCEKIKNYNQCDQGLKDAIRIEAAQDDIDLLVAILRSEDIKPELKPEEIGRAFNAYVAWNSAVENVSINLRRYTTPLTNPKSRSTKNSDQVPRPLLTSSNYSSSTHVKEIRP